MILCWFLPVIDMSQPQVYVCPLPLETSSTFHSLPLRVVIEHWVELLCHTANSHWLSNLHMVIYIFLTVFINTS